MKALRHRLGRWLLRDDLPEMNERQRAQLEQYVEQRNRVSSALARRAGNTLRVQFTGADIQIDRVRHNGGKDLGLP